jgi:hypothetical protein
MQRMVAAYLVLSWPWALVVAAIGFGLIPEAIFGTCRKRSTLGILSRSWPFIPTLQATSLAGPHLGPVVLELLARVIRARPWLRVFLPAAVLGAHREGSSVAVDAVGRDVVVAWARLQSVAQRTRLPLPPHCDLRARFASAQVVLAWTWALVHLPSIARRLADPGLIGRYFQAGLCLPMLAEL